MGTMEGFRNSLDSAPKGKRASGQAAAATTSAVSGGMTTPPPSVLQLWQVALLARVHRPPVLPQAPASRGHQRRSSWSREGELSLWWQEQVFFLSSWTSIKEISYWGLESK
ncbi:uncharacterized protein LOC144825254 [Lissotriton helveticus]